MRTLTWIAVDLTARLCCIMFVLLCLLWVPIVLAGQFLVALLDVLGHCIERLFHYRDAIRRRTMPTEPAPRLNERRL